jgi:cell division septum initiation protein DivIVA
MKMKNLENLLTSYERLLNSNSVEYEDLEIFEYLKTNFKAYENIDEEIFKLNRRISELEEYIAEQGDIHDQCTYNILNKTICNGCKCGRLK